MKGKTNCIQRRKITPKRTWNFQISTYQNDFLIPFEGIQTTIYNQLEKNQQSAS